MSYYRGLIRLTSSLLKSQGDQTFGGTRASFSRAATLFSRIPDYWQNVRAFWPVDFELLRRSDGCVNKHLVIVQEVLKLRQREPKPSK